MNSMLATQLVLITMIMAIVRVIAVITMIRAMISRDSDHHFLDRFIYRPINNQVPNCCHLSSTPLFGFTLVMPLRRSILATSLAVWTKIDVLMDWAVVALLNEWRVLVPRF